MRLITLTTDFGLTDTYVGVMKGVIAGIAPHASVIDLTHAIGPQNIVEATVRLEAAIDYFPEGTIHLVVVDPGVGSEREAVVIETERSLFIGPNNGVFTLPLRRHPPRRIVRLTAAAEPYSLPHRSATFHGRDLFAPVAAHLANGLNLTLLGKSVPAESLVTLSLPTPETIQKADGWQVLLHVLYADHFGNLITDMTCHSELISGVTAETFLAQASSIEITAGSLQWRGLARTYADVLPNTPLLYWGSAGRLEVAIRDGNAAQSLPLASGDIVSLSLFFA